MIQLVNKRKIGTYSGERTLLPTSRQHGQVGKILNSLNLYFFRYKTGQKVIDKGEYLIIKEQG